MKKTKSSTAALFPLPDNLNSDSDSLSRAPSPPSVPAAPPRRKPTAKAGTKPAKRAGAPATAPGQGFLPGLSRRGRPRRKDAPPPAVRAAESRKRRQAAGSRRLELMLDAAVLAQLDALAAHHRETRVEAITRLVLRAARRLPAAGDSGA